MSYRGAAALQAAIWQRLSAWPGLAGVPVLDAVPAGQGPQTYVLIGPEEVRDASDASGPGAEHRLSISVITRAAGFSGAKAVAGAVSEALAGNGLILATGRLVDLWFLRAQARRLENGALRRIDMIYRARLDFD